MCIPKDSKNPGEMQRLIINFISWVEILGRSAVHPLPSAHREKMNRSATKSTVSLLACRNCSFVDYFLNGFKTTALEMSQPWGFF